MSEDVRPGRRETRETRRNRPGDIELTLSRRTTVALVPDEPPGMVFSHSVGAVRVEATLAGREPLETRKRIIQRRSPVDGARWDFSQKRKGGGISVRGSIFAFDEAEMGFALEAVMRSISEAAAGFDALLETRVVREARVEIVPLEVVESLVSDMEGAGFPVSRGVSWSPAGIAGAESGVRVGVGRDATFTRGLTTFLEDHESWEIS